MMNAASIGSRRLGIVQTAFSGALFGLLGLFGKRLFENGVSPGELLSFRFSMAALILWPLTIALHPTRWRLSLQEMATCFALGAAGYAVFSFSFFVALKGLSASLAVLLLYTYPVMVTGAAWILFGHAVPRSKWAALPLTVFGTVLLVWGEISVHQIGAFFSGILSAILYSVYILASSRLLSRIPALVSLTYILTAAGLFMSLLHFHDPGRIMSVFRENLLILFGVAILSTVGAMSLFLAGLKRLMPWEVSLLSTLEPVTGIVLAAVFLHERLGWVQLLGALGVFAGLVIVSLPDLKQSEK